MVNLLNDQADPQLLLGRRILVTGAGDGIGKEAALTYARHGAHLFLLGRTRNKLETLAQQIQQETGMTPNILVFDLASSDPAAYQQLAQTPSLLLAPLDGLLLNAGLLGSLGPVAELDPQEWQQVLQINLGAAAHSGVITVTALELVRSHPVHLLRRRSSGKSALGRLCGLQVCDRRADAGPGSRAGRYIHSGQCHQSGSHPYTHARPGLSR